MTKQLGNDKVKDLVRRISLIIGSRLQRPEMVSSGLLKATANGPQAATPTPSEASGYIKRTKLSSCVNASVADHNSSILQTHTPVVPIPRSNGLRIYRFQHRSTHHTCTQQILVGVVSRSTGSWLSGGGLRELGAWQR